MTTMRYTAEKERTKYYRELSQTQGVAYFKCLSQILDTLPTNKDPAEFRVSHTKSKSKSNWFQYNRSEYIFKCISFIVDYIKILIENGLEFTEERFAKVLSMIDAPFVDTEIHEIIDEIIVKNFEFDKEKLIECLEPLLDEEQKIAFKLVPGEE